MSKIWICALAALFSVGCPPPKTETPTSGKLEALVTESLAPLMQKEADEFQRLYPEASVRILATSTRDAIVQLLNDSVSFIVVDRQLNEEEQGVAKKYEITYVETKIAEDALAVLVHKQNPMENISLTSLEKILSGKLSAWRNVPESKWSGTIELALTPRNSGAYELLTNHFFQLQEPIIPRIVLESQHEVFKYVAMNERAAGFISLTALHDTIGQPETKQFKTSTRVLAVGGKDTAKTFVKLHQANIYRQLYPLHYPVYIYTTAKHASLAAGFSAFITSVPGQKIILYAGLVPATMPVRLVQITQEQLSR